MKQYHLEVRGELFFTQAALKHQGRVRVVELLIDCGASQAIFSWGTLISLGIDPAISTARRRLITANGAIHVPEITLSELDALGQQADNLKVSAHNIPLGSQVAGVLGMNFLRRFDTNLNFKQATILI